MLVLGVFVNKDIEKYESLPTLRGLKVTFGLVSLVDFESWYRVIFNEFHCNFKTLIQT